MQNVFEAELQFRAAIRERTPAMVESWEYLSWLNEAVQRMARKSWCYERETIIAAEDTTRRYEWKMVLPDFAGKVRLGYYRNFPLNLIQDSDTRWNWQSLFTSTSNQPLAFYYDGQWFALRNIPKVTTYSTGTAGFTPGSKIVTGVGTVWNTGVAPYWGMGLTAEPFRLYPIRVVVSDTVLELEYPFPEETPYSGVYLATDGPIRLTYAAVPPRLLTVSYDTGMIGTLTFTNRSKVVTSTGAPVWTKTARRGMMIGHGTKTGVTKPIKWYSIERPVTDGELKLAIPFEEPTVLTASGVLTDANPFEAAYLEVANRYPIAVGKLKSGDSGAHDRWMIDFERGMDQARAEIDQRYGRSVTPPRMRDVYWGYVPGLDDGEG